MPLPRTLYRWHIWLGWVLAVPFLLWTLSGLIMVVRPIEEVRGEHLRAKPQAVETAGLVLPIVSGPAKGMRLTHIGGRDQWIVEKEEGLSRFDAHSGALLADITGAEARALADQLYTGTAAITGARSFPAAAPPLDLRKNRPSWQVSFADGAHIYIDAESGETLAVRTRYWRIFDFFWGLHILDPRTRENTHSPWLIVFAAMGFASIVIGSIMLVKRQFRERRL